MVSSHHEDLSSIAPRVAMLFTNRWAEAAVAEALQNAGMVVDKYSGALALVAALHSPKADIAVVEDHGVHLTSCLAALRFRGAATVPIVAVGQGSTQEIARALRHGAADYAVLGEAMESLVNRVRARMEVCRHRDQPSSLRVGVCELDEPSRTLRHPGGEFQLTWREFALAWVLFEHVGQVVNLHTLSQQVWGRDVSVAKRTIEQHISRLRRKLIAACTDTREAVQVHAIHNVGYRLVLEPRQLAEAKGRGAGPEADSLPFPFDSSFSAA